MNETRCFKKFEISIVVLFAFWIFLWSPILAEWNKIDSPCLCKEFRCNGGVFCLHASKVCNGVPDCVGGEDEKGYDGTGKCVRKRAKCSPDEFKCKFGDCIKLDRVCDGKIDCWGGVDEASDFCTWVHGDSNDTETEMNATSRSTQT